MDLLAVLPAFPLAVVLTSASPGPAMALILRRAALRGTRGAVPTILGLEVGLYLLAVHGGAGVAAVGAAAEVAFPGLRLGRAAVLLVLGLRAWYGVWKDRGNPGEPPEPRRHSV